MKVLLAHNEYMEPGGEDVVFARECQLLRSRGHEVITYEVSNRTRLVSSGSAAVRAFWSLPAGRDLRRLVEEHRPDVCHFHNVFPLISPAAYRTCRRRGATIVQTLHNYRLLCPASSLFRDNAPCTLCRQRRLQLPAIQHGCYRGSRSASAVVAAVNASHRALGTWHQSVDLYIALTQFAREQFLAGGFTSDEIFVKPNFVDPDPGVGCRSGHYAVFVGRLSHEKGVRILLDAWRLIGDRVPLRIAGTGPLEHLLETPPTGVTWVGQRSRQEVTELMHRAAILVFPSEGYETFGLTIAEAFATGLPVVCSGRGAAAELVQHGVTGFQFASGDVADLAEKTMSLWNDPVLQQQMGIAARREFELKYAPQRNYELLLDAYHVARRRRAERNRAPQGRGFPGQQGMR